VDGKRFDDLTRSLAAGTTRRGFTRTLVAGLAGALGLSAQRGLAKPKGGGGGKPQGRCPEGFTNCRGTCVDLTDHQNHCGACNLQCSAGEECCGGVCRAACPGDTLRDNATCGCGCPPATPNLCPATNVCSSACTAPRVFDPATCTCACPACAEGKVLDEDTCICHCPAPTGCCACFDDDAGGFVHCVTHVENADCEAACAAAGGRVSFFSSPQLGESYVYTSGLTCDITCQPDFPGF
jgi:hypothetical protein